MLLPIKEYESLPLISLEEAANNLTFLVPEIAHMAWTVKKSRLETGYDLIDDESASILLYKMDLRLCLAHISYVRHDI
jgi:hypothetical protein